MKALSNKNYWEKYWKKEKRSFKNDFIFSEIIEKSITDIKDLKTYIEIGCAPGEIMSYFAHNYNLEVTGIDFVNKQQIEANLKNNNVLNFDIKEIDFLQYEVNKKYDIVASFGFVEHFNDYEIIIKKQMEMVAPGGYLILEMPNIRKFNYLIYKIFDRKLLNIHNLKVMDRKVIHNIISSDKNFSTIFNNYYLTCFLMLNNQNAFFIKHKIIGKVFFIINKVFNVLHLTNIPNSFFSPYIMYIAKNQ